MTDQNIIFLFLAGALLITLFAFLRVSYLLAQKRKQNTYQLEKQQIIFNHQNNTLRAKLEEQENIMNQISKELHDNVQSVLGFAQMSMYRIADFTTNTEQQLLVDNTNKLVGQVLTDIHNISRSLNSNFIENIGLIETITKELENIRLSRNIIPNIEIIGIAFSLGPEKELHIYRIAQEAIQNCIKHAKATNLRFLFNYKQDLFMMQITDDGIGFEKTRILEMKGLGFLNMFQRARYVLGSLEVESAPHEGCSIILTVDLNTEVPI